MRLMTADVIDTYLSYKCPNNLAAHNMSQYNVTYKRISFRTSYERDGETTSPYGIARNCSCGYGTVTHHVVHYHTW